MLTLSPTAAASLVEVGNQSLSHVSPDVIAEFDTMLRQHLASQQELITQAAVQYSREHYARMSGLLPDGLVSRLQQETSQLTAANTRRIDIRVAVTGNTRRRLGSLPNSLFVERSTQFTALYHVPAFRSLLNSIAGVPVLDCTYPDEQITGTHQTEVGDTHGWHWGDHEFAWIFISAAPGPEHGGLLQTVPHTPWNKQNPAVNRCLMRGKIRTYHHASGECYFFKTNTTLHRTTPIEAEGVTRSIVNLTFAGIADLMSEKTYETTDAVYLD
ncbi:MAG: HalD/BesD family halogenase [Streptosporangiaceae bacterium]